MRAILNNRDDAEKGFRNRAYSTYSGGEFESRFRKATIQPLSAIFGVFGAEIGKPFQNKVNSASSGANSTYFWCIFAYSGWKLRRLCKRM